MQAKDIPERPILQFLQARNWEHPMRPGCIFVGFDNSVFNAMPEGTPEKVGRAKMNALIRKGLVDGCTCGCRGDFELTGEGVKALRLHLAPKG